MFSLQVLRGLCISFLGRKFGVTDFGADVVKLVSHATQQRLQNVLQKVTEVAQQRNISFKVCGTTLSNE